MTPPIDNSKFVALLKAIHIKLYKKEIGCQAWFARQVGISERHASNICNNRYPVQMLQEEKIVAIAKKMKIPVDL